jgi:hypothetical protein
LRIEVCRGEPCVRPCTERCMTNDKVTLKTEAMTIKAKNNIGLGLAISLLVLGGLNMGEIIIFKTKYIFCIIVAVVILMLAALVFEIAGRSRGIICLKLLYLTAWILLGGAAVAVVILPLFVTWQNWRPYDMMLRMVNLGLILMLFFLKEVVRNWKNSPRKLGKPQHQSLDDCYFDELPRVMRHKKRIDVYFE